MVYMEQLVIRLDLIEQTGNKKLKYCTKS